MPTPLVSKKAGSSLAFSESTTAFLKSTPGTGSLSPLVWTSPPWSTLAVYHSWYRWESDICLAFWAEKAAGSHNYVSPRAAGVHSCVSPRCTQLFVPKGSTVHTPMCPQGQQMHTPMSPRAADAHSFMSPRAAGAHSYVSPAPALLLNSSCAVTGRGTAGVRGFSFYTSASIANLPRSFLPYFFHT